MLMYFDVVMILIMLPKYIGSSKKILDLNAVYHLEISEFRKYGKRKVENHII